MSQILLVVHFAGSQTTLANPETLLAGYGLLWLSNPPSLLFYSFGMFSDHYDWLLISLGLLQDPSLLIYRSSISSWQALKYLLLALRVRCWDEYLFLFWAL